MGQMEAVTAQLKTIVLGRIDADKLVLPLLPTTIDAYMHQLGRASSSSQELEQALGRDPLLAAILLKNATSGDFTGMDPVTSMPKAVERLGQQRTRKILGELAQRKLFLSRNAPLTGSTKALYAHSLAVALLARDLMALGDGGDPEEAYLTGLLHDVGKPIVAAVFLELERAIGYALNDELTILWDDVMIGTSKEIGLALCEKWHLPEAVVDLIKDSSEFDMMNRKSPANFVKFANAVAKIDGFPAGRFDEQDANAMIMVGRSILEIDDDVLSRLRGDLKSRVEALMS